MSKLKIIFFGTPSFAVDSLHEIQLNYSVDFIVTTPDKKSGRGQKINESEVKQYAKKNNIKILQPENLNDKEFINQIEAIQPDLIVVVAFRKLPFEIFSIPKYGTINLHASLLPNYRGAAPINWCLINNEKKTGVTTFYINERIDQGDILLKEEIIISDEDDFGSLYMKLSSIGSKLLVKTINGIITNTLKASKQIKDENDTRKKNLFLDKEGKIFFDMVYSSQKTRIFNALKNSSSDSVIKFKEVLNKIIDGR